MTVVLGIITAAAALTPPTPDESSIVLYVTTGLAVLAALAVWVPKILGPLGKAISEAASSMRRAGQDAEDSRITDLGSQLAAKTERNTALEKENGGLRRMVYRIRESSANHVAWDWRALGVLRRTDPDYPAPPALHAEDVDAP